jgi:hypothetical protein
MPKGSIKTSWLPVQYISRPKPPPPHLRACISRACSSYGRVATPMGHMLLIGVHLIGGRPIDVRLAGMRLIVVCLTGLCLIGRASHMRVPLS